MNYSFNLSLSLTSVASNTILSSTSSLFTLILSFFLLGHRFQPIDLAGVLTTIGGVALVSLRDWQISHDTVVGDVIGLVSAFFYGVWTTALKLKLKDERCVNMLIFFGLLGLFNVMLMWPIMIFLNFIDFEPFNLPSLEVLGFLALNGMFSVLSDYLWARSILITSPLVATVGLSLTIPIAMLFDFTFMSVKFSWMYFFGSCLVVIGFLLINFSFSRQITSETVPHSSSSSSSSNLPSSESSSLVISTEKLTESQPHSSKRVQSEQSPLLCGDAGNEAAQESANGPSN
eukprot:TRINITY_DN1942_c0_g1_i9.p1 TRINITY_DN1942_c0_g1~~TRINITY_DN1942_c0_g1_i9.p1  ORF type:complete len:288 (+),score=72.43 TRINITY_DN1942_c0_g1_i9:235-1098(+)